MKRQYPGKRQNYAKFCTGSKYGEKRLSGERKKKTRAEGERVDHDRYEKWVTG